MKAFVLNGANLNMLGKRQPELYGTSTLEDIRRLCETEAAVLGLEIEMRQSNSDGALADWIAEADAAGAGVVLNAGAFARTSLVLHDAVTAATCPVVEVHISNIYRRETYRPPSMLSRAAAGLICGFGVDVYPLGLRALAGLMRRATP